MLGAEDFSSPHHLATGSVRDWFIVKEIFFYPWFHMVWTGLHVAPHATANVFSIRCLISRELASDEACWQRNGRESFRRLHQMAALLRHLGQNLVDGELAAGAAFFFFPLFYFPSLFDKMSQTSHSSNSHLIFFTLFSEAASHCFLLPSFLCHSLTWVPRILALAFHGTVFASCCFFVCMFFVFWVFFFLKVSEVLRWR